MVVDALCRERAFDAARTFAKATSGAATRGLGRYVDSCVGASPEDKARAALATLGEAIAPADKLAALREAGPVGASVVGVRLGVAHAATLRVLGKLAESANQYAEVAEIAQRLGWLTAAADAFREAGRGARMALDAKLGREVLSKAARLYEQIGRPRFEADVRRLYAENLAYLGQHEAAAEQAQAAVRLWRKLEDKTQTAIALNTLGSSRTSLGDSDGAVKSFREALALFTELKQQRGTAMVSVNLARIRLAQGEVLEARQAYQKAIEVFTELGDRRSLVQTMLNLGITYQRTGDYDTAVAEFARARSLAAQTGDVRAMTQAINNLAAMQMLRGDYAQALRGYDEAGKLARRSGEPRLQVLNLLSVGMAKERLGDLEGAKRQYEAALALARKTQDVSDAYQSLQLLAGVMAHLEEFDEALVHLKEALALVRRARARAPESDMLAVLGMVHAKRGEWAMALEAFDQSLAIGENVQVLLNRGAVLRNLKRFDEADAVFRSALAKAAEEQAANAHVRALVRVAESDTRKGAYDDVVPGVRKAMEIIGRMTQGLAERESSVARDLAIESLLDLGLRACAVTRDLESANWIIERSRAVALREGLGSRAVVESVVIPKPLRLELAKARATEAQALFALGRARTTSDRQSRRTARRALDAAREALAKVTDHLDRRVRSAASLGLSPPNDLAATQQHLGPREALVLYAAAEQAHALVVTRTKARLVALGDGASIRAVIDRTLEALIDRTDPAASLAKLVKLIATPLALDEGIERVLVSPMGRLGYVPFALVFPQREVAYTPSGTAHGLLRRSARKRGEKVLALGDPLYAQARSPTGRAPAPLPATRKEVESVGDVRLLGGEATEARLRAALGEETHWRAVHFACHGLVDAERPRFSSLALTPEAPDDGFLRAVEILDMRVPADLVVLSACETGRGKIYKSEGIVGLTRAFMYAGAPRVLCSLWKVDDDATRALMVEFYARWRPSKGRGLSVAAALKAAQAHVRQQERWAHPFYWAGWALWGLSQ